MLSFESNTETSNVKVRIRYKWRVIFIRSGCFTEEITCTRIPAFAQLPRDAKLVKETRFPIQRQSSHVVDVHVLGPIPTCPFDIHLDVPIRCRTKRDTS